MYIEKLFYSEWNAEFSEPVKPAVSIYAVALLFIRCRFLGWTE